MPGSLLPFDRCRGLARHVVNDPVDSLDLVADPVRRPVEKLGRQPGPIGGHCVQGLDRSQGDGLGIGPHIPHHTDAAGRQEDAESLPKPIVEPRFPDLVDENGIRPSQGIQAL